MQNVGMNDSPIDMGITDGKLTLLQGFVRFIDYFLLMYIYRELLARWIDHPRVHMLLIDSLMYPIGMYIALSTDLTSSSFPPVLARLCY